MMNWPKRFYTTALAMSLAVSLAAGAQAADYAFTTDAPQDYYGSTSYEDTYGSRYNYGGLNVVDYQVPELEYGLLSNTQIGIMERSLLPGLQAASAVWDGEGGYGISGDGLAEMAFPDLLSVPNSVQGQQTAYTSVDGLEREDGSIGTLEVPVLGISMNVWEGETNESMRKGLGHYSSSSAWDGNVALCGHNRGAK